MIPASHLLYRRVLYCALLALCRLCVMGATTETNRPPASTSIAPELKVADNFLLAIPKTGFGKDYLFSASLIPQARAATSTGLAAKLVRFELFPDGVDMYES
ncbi:MAG TPA: hypothetical protein VKY92_09190, partial [Verrucomicrobiae bacterium]|nr:hypothetical protein [Verrucomicrobiae bacterium]